MPGEQQGATISAKLKKPRDTLVTDALDRVHEHVTRLIGNEHGHTTVQIENCSLCMSHRSPPGSGSGYRTLHVRTEGVLNAGRR
jgi:hypothetical protein